MRKNLQSLKRPPKHREFGIALISVLWIILLLSALAAASTYISRSNAILVNRSLELTLARAAADAAVTDTISKLSDAMVDRHYAVDGAPHDWQFGDTSVKIAVSYESGRIDLNSADSDLLFAFLMSQHLAKSESVTLIRDLRNWQQMTFNEQDIYNRQPAVDQRAIYERKPLEYVQQIREISSWNQFRLDCWLPAFTVYSGLNMVSDLVAEPTALQALIWAQEAHLGDRQWVSPSRSTTQIQTNASLLGELLRIEAHADTRDHVTASSTWIGRLTGHPTAPTLTMRWDHKSSATKAVCADPTQTPRSAL